MPDLRAVFFFPQRIELKIDGGSYSPRVLEKAITASAHAPSYELGSKLLRVVGEIDIAGRQLNKLAVRIGAELSAARDARTDAYFDQPLPRQPTPPMTTLSSPSLSCDGGRMQTRLVREGSGVHGPHWRETKNAVFLRTNGVSCEEDPHPHLPPAGRRSLTIGVRKFSFARASVRLSMAMRSAA